MKEHHKKFNSLNNLKPRTKDNKLKRLEVLIYAGYIYNELYYIYKSKCNREIDRLSVWVWKVKKAWLQKIKSWWS